MTFVNTCVYMQMYMYMHRMARESRPRLHFSIINTARPLFSREHRATDIAAMR
jgi:hypothetical protein